ncbi:hypothetical protein LIER_29288 [Lithospermum erythrorhizon]|uniref:Uncharacterized protein n=1 Tax=Lithospermum erythrorhizon TaxID=34254 RepID=A0AAV3RNS8_LITER
MSQFDQQLPNAFIGGLNEQGGGCVIIRYRGYRIPVLVRDHKLGMGWRTLINRANVISGTTLLAAYSGGRVVALLKYNRGVSLRSAWHLNVNAFDIVSELLKEDDIPEDAVATEAVRTAYFPPFMALFFTRPSGVCTFNQTDYLSMRLPYNLAERLTLDHRTSVNIRSGERLFEDMNVSLQGISMEQSCWVQFATKRTIMKMITIPFSFFFVLTSCDIVTKSFTVATPSPFVFLELFPTFLTFFLGRPFVFEIGGQ